MYKLTFDGKTMVGNNEDAWRTTPHIWFETRKNDKFGCCFTGSRAIGQNKYAAQSGINEYGLTFSRLTAYHPQMIDPDFEKKEKINEPDLFLMNVLHSCKNVDEVYAFFERFDHSCFLHDVFVYVEPSGKYLVVEPYKLKVGTDPHFVQSNFCPSITVEEIRRKQPRYRNGIDLLRTKIDTSLSFCTQVSNDMHVCRDKIGDGTLLTTIWDTKNRSMHLYFYHDYTTRVSFDLMEELSKGDHQFKISSLFPTNTGFEQLKSYVTPFNTPTLRIALALLGLFFFLSSLFFASALFHVEAAKGLRSLKVGLSIVLLTAFWYMFVLTTNIEVFYFSAPYTHYSSSLISISSFIPYLILICILAVLWLHWRKNSFNSWSKISKVVLTVNSAALIGTIIGFLYWGLFF